MRPRAPYRAIVRSILVLSLISARCFLVAPLRRPVCRTALAAVAAKGPLQRLAGDVVATVTWPYRFWQLAGITKEVGEVIKSRFRGNKGAKEKGSGAAGQLKSFLPIYMRSHVTARTDAAQYRQLLNTSLNLLVDSILAETPYAFQPYHKALRGPGVDHYAWGNDFFRSMVKFRLSRVEGLENVKSIQALLDAGDNVVFLANHQTEADPQVLSLLLDREGYGNIAERCIFVAGHKVTTDPLAVPFSMGRNLLTIFSKKYLDAYNETEREAKSERNRLTVGEMQRLMTEGSHVFWVAPSGGRDRRSSLSGKFEPAKFDPQSVGLFQLLAQKAGSKGKGHQTHFFPLAMWSHRMVPPPEGTAANVGEARSAARAPIAVEFGPEMDPEALGGRKKFPEAAEQIVRACYAHLDGVMQR